MLPKVNISKQFPGPYEAFAAFDAKVKEATQAAGLSPLLVELVKLRVSQINGCAFCLRMQALTSVGGGFATHQRRWRVRCWPLLGQSYVRRCEEGRRRYRCRFGHQRRQVGRSSRDP